jgi:hypothetical protein
MSQLIACRSRDGIVLAADSKAVDFDSSGKLQEHAIDRLVQLNQQTALLAGGAAAGTFMAESFQRFVAEESIDDVEDVFGAALPFLATEYEKFMRKTCEVLPVDPVHHVHFILAGVTRKDARNPFRLYFLWTKRKLPQLDGDAIETVFTVPRLIRVEYNLNRLCRDNVPMESIVPAIRAAMERQVEIQDEVGGPCTYAMIDAKGLQRLV